MKVLLIITVLATTVHADALHLRDGRITSGTCTDVLRNAIETLIATTIVHRHDGRMTLRAQSGDGLYLTVKRPRGDEMLLLDDEAADVIVSQKDGMWGFWNPGGKRSMIVHVGPRGNVRVGVILRNGEGICHEVWDGMGVP